MTFPKSCTSVILSRCKVGVVVKSVQFRYRGKNIGTAPPVSVQLATMQNETHLSYLEIPMRHTPFDMEQDWKLCVQPVFRGGGGGGG